MSVKDIPTKGKCFNCHAEISNDFYCFGCKEFICDGESCEGGVGYSLASATGYGHESEDHLVESDNEDGE